MPEDHFGPRVAERFDERYGYQADPAVVDPMVDLLAELAGDGRALELGIGTGRIALPLARRGVPVHGIDLSEAMVAKLQAKPGAEEIGVTIGDFATTRVDGTFSVAYLVANTIMNLTTQEEQVACFRNVAAHLGPGGCFVIEVQVPRLQRLPPGERFQPFDVSPHHLGFDEYDVASQGLVSHHYWIEDGEVEVLSPPFRYVWPSELDLMAQLAGMTLRERWEDWQRRPFTSESDEARLGVGEAVTLGEPRLDVESCESTQLLVDTSLPEGALVVADHQTAGRGRLGRSWEAPAGTALLFSLLLKPPPERHAPELSLVAGLAVADALERTLGLSVQIKWPNDVMLRRKKIAGCLAEARDGAVVLGIGVNVGQTAEELPDGAGSIRTLTGGR